MLPANTFVGQPMLRYLSLVLIFSFGLAAQAQTNADSVFDEPDSVAVAGDTAVDTTNALVTDTVAPGPLVYTVSLPDTNDQIADSAVVAEEVQSEPPVVFDFKRQEPGERKARTYPWVFIMALFVMILIGVLRALDSTRYFYAIRTPFRSFKSEWGFFDLIPGIDLYQIIFILIYCIIFSFALHIYQPFGLELNFQADWRNYLVLLLIVMVVYTTKYSLYLMVFQVLQTDKLPRMMVVSMSNLSFLFAIFAFPVLLVAYYSLSEVLRQYLGVGFAVLLVLFFVYRFLRMLFLTWENFRFNRLYIILYLCTLEMLPLLILANEVM